MHPLLSRARPPAVASHPDSSSGEEIRAVLRRLLASPDFPASARNRRFLEFVVGRVLGGEPNAVSAYAIATEVFGRAPDFRPSEDPIVRVEAGKLRQDLETYYLKSGRDEAIRIELPKGGYAPIFERAVPREETGPSGSVGDADPSAELERVLGSSDFVASARNRRFLAHLVERALDGDPARVGAYEIGTRVFGFPESFDSTRNPIVRIEAGKLRRALETYYLKSGRFNPCRISIPKGRYRAEFAPSA